MASLTEEASSLVVINEEHASNMLKFLYDCWKKEICCDVTVKVGPKLFLTHRFVLAMISDYFKVYLQRDGKNEDTVSLFDVDKDIFEAVLYFGYTGEIHNEVTNIQELAVCADYLGISTLKHICDKKLVNEVTKENCLLLLIFSDIYTLPCLLKVCKKVWCQHFRELYDTKEFLLISPKLFMTLLNDNMLKLWKTKSQTHNVKVRESLLFKSVLRYINHNVETLKYEFTELLELLKAVKLPLLDYSYMIKQIKDCKNLKTNVNILSLFDLANLYQCSEIQEDNPDIPKYWLARRLPTNCAFQCSGPFASGGQVGIRNYKKFGEVTNNYAKIKQIKLWIRLWDGRSVIGGIEVSYDDGVTVGGGERSGLEKHVIDLEDDEYVTKIQINSGYMIDCLMFITDKKKTFGPFGGDGGGTKTVWGNCGENTHLFGIQGASVLTQLSLGIVELSFKWISLS